MVRGRKGQHKDVLDAIRKAGFVRARVDGEVIDVDQVAELAAAQEPHDRGRGRSDRGSRGRRSRGWPSRSGWRVTHGEGAVLAIYLRPGENGAPTRPTDSGTSGCSARTTPARTARSSYEELEPRTFSFNSPYGACPTCEGLGCRVQFDPELVLPDASLSLADGRDRALEGEHAGRGCARHKAQLARLPESAGIRLEHADWRS